MVFGTLGASANQVLIKIKGDDKDYQNALKKSDSSTASFVSKIKSYGPMIGAAFGAAAVGFVAMSVKMAAAEEAVSRQTEALLKSQGVMWGAVGEELDIYMKQLEKLTAYNDTDLQVAFNAMIAAGMSYTEAMENMNTVTSMAYSLNRDLNSMALLVGKAYNGQTGELSRYGIVLDESLDKSEKFAGLQKHVADNFADASDRADSFEGQMEALTNQTSNFAEAVGVELLPGLTEFVQQLVEGADASDSFATKLGKALAIPFEISTTSIQLKPLEEELAMIKNIEAGGMLSEEGEKRKQIVIFEMQQLQNADEITEANRKTQEWMQKYTDATYAAMGYDQTKLDIAKQQTNELKNQTSELEKQLTMEQRAARSPSSVKQNVGSASMSQASVDSMKSTYGVTIKPSRINPNITSSVRSGL